MPTIGPPKLYFANTVAEGLAIGDSEEDWDGEWTEPTPTEQFKGGKEWIWEAAVHTRILCSSSSRPTPWWSLDLYHKRAGVIHEN